MLPAKILVLRFSAMGDVALTLPVIRSLVAEYPQTEIVLATRPKFAVFFRDQKNITVLPVDLDRNFKGVFGLWNLFKLLKNSQPDAVVDLHDHLRTIVVRNLFRLSQIPIVTFKKGRKGKKAITARNNKKRVALPHTVERYQQAFQKLGFNFLILKSPHILLTDQAMTSGEKWLTSKSNVESTIRIGIAPFAAHLTKIWSFDNYSNVIEQLSAKGKYQFFLFGGGQREVDQFRQLESKFSNVVTVAGMLKLEEELAVMSKLQLMLCVDSSNMHLAALLGVNVLSIWGGTHLSTGFGPVDMQNNSILEIPIEDLPCRPCSVYGTGKCLRGDFACLTRITAKQVVSSILQKTN